MNKFREYFLMGGGVVLVAFMTAVVGLTVQRIQNANPTVGESQAASCNSSSPACVWACFQQGTSTVQAGNCSGCWNLCTGTSGGGNNTGGAGTGGTQTQSGWQRFNYSDSKFTYLTSPSCWFTVSSLGVTYNQSGHNSPTMPNCGPTNTQSVKFNTTGTGISFDQIKVGYAQWTYGALIPVTLDGSSLSQFDAKGTQSGPNRALQSWTSPTFTCGEHQVGLGVDTTGRSGASVLDLAFVEVHLCGSGAPSSGGTCTPANQTHLACVNGACAHVAGAGDNTDGCTTVGSSCSGSCSPAQKCQGNSGNDGTCYDCNGDGVINILDFSCFANNWMETVSGTKPAACNQ